MAESICGQVITSFSHFFSFLVALVRLMYATDKYTDRILPTVKELPLWLTPGEDLVKF